MAKLKTFHNWTCGQCGEKVHSLADIQKHAGKHAKQNRVTLVELAKAHKHTARVHKKVHAGKAPHNDLAAAVARESELRKKVHQHRAVAAAAKARKKKGGGK